MANRSYIYSIDFDRTLEHRSENKKVCGLSELNYSIPLAYKILVSQNSKISPSVIFDYEKPIAIIGDFYKGREKLFLFLDELLKTDIIDKDELKREIKTSKEFLYDAEHENKYAILECGEIYTMNDGELEEHNRKLYEEEIVKIDETIKTFMDEIQKISVTGELAKLARRNRLTPAQAINGEKLNRLGISFWCDTLYYE
jgi:hypothetical protein